MRFLSLVALALFLSPVQAQTPSFKAGFAERDITPDIGMEAPGGYGKSYHRTLHDPCKVRAAVFDDGRNTVALVGIDALGIERVTALKVRKAINGKTGIAENAILLGASHSHSSGPLSGVMPGDYDHASELVKDLAYNKSTTVDPKFLDKCERALIDAVGAAFEARTDVRAGIGRGKEEQVAFNRRFRMRDGSTITHPGQGNEAIVEPAGPVDPEVGVIGCWDKDRRKLIGCIVNFSCHATTSPGGISANYVYYVEKIIKGYYGPETVVVFLNGASGDVTQVDNRNPLRHRDPEAFAAFVGGRVGAEALKVLLTMEPGALPPVSAETRLLRVKRRSPDPERVEKCLEMVKKPAVKGQETEWTFAKEIVMLDARIRKEPIADVEVQAVQVGPAVFLTTPAEYFCEFGLKQKAASGFPFTFPVSLANGCVGYVPTEEAFGPHGGGYETRLTSYSNLEITAGTRMMEAGIELAKHMKPGEVPQRPKHPPFTSAWSYGNVKPEIK
jgi:neutral ceramidase